MSVIDHDLAEPDTTAPPADPFTRHCPDCLKPLEHRSVEAHTYFHNGEYCTMGMNHMFRCSGCGKSTGWQGGWYQAMAVVKGWGQ